MKLEGIRVLDLSLFLPGPMVTQMMADHGADVIKIEAPGEGEPTRQIGQRRDGESVYFACTQRGKRSVMLNLKDPGGKAVFFRLAADADVIVESFRPGVVDRLGVGARAVRSRFPRVVYASISAFGQDGPLASRPAHDLAVEAMCGLLSNNLDAAGNPCLPAMPAGDMLASLTTLSAITMALLRRERTGVGDRIDVSMMDSILAMMPNSMGAAFGEKRAPVPSEERIWGGNAFYRIYACKDGRHVVLGGVEPKFVRNLLGRLGREDLIPLCAAPGAAQQPVVDFLTATFGSRTRDEWEAWFEGMDVCFAPVNDLRTGLDLPQTRHRDMVLVDARGFEHLGTPVRFADEPGVIRFQAPGHGEHTDAVLAEAGYSAAERTQLRSAGIC